MNFVREAYESLGTPQSIMVGSIDTTLGVYMVAMALETNARAGDMVDKVVANTIALPAGTAIGLFGLGLLVSAGHNAIERFRHSEKNF